MTSDRKGTWPEPSDDERCVDALLAESGFPADDRLRQVLLQLRGLRNGHVPPPSAELARLLEHPEASGVVPLAGEADRRRNRHRIAFTTLAVAASLGVAGGAAAGNDTIRRGAEATISTIVRSFTHPAPAPQAPSEPATAPVGPAAVVPSPDMAEPPASSTVATGTAPLPAGIPATALPVDPVPGASVPDVSAPPPLPPARASDAGGDRSAVVPGDGGKAPEPPAAPPAGPPAAQPPRADDGDGAGKHVDVADSAGKGNTGAGQEDVANPQHSAEPPSWGR